MILKDPRNYKNLLNIYFISKTLKDHYKVMIIVYAAIIVANEIWRVRLIELKLLS